MTKLNPNKEIIRRICFIFKCEKCWMLNKTHQISLLVHIDTEEVDTFKLELESWTGCTFAILNKEAPIEKQEAIILSGEQLVPISEDTPLFDIEMRRKHMHKKTG